MWIKKNITKTFDEIFPTVDDMTDTIEEYFGSGAVELFEFKQEDGFIVYNLLSGKYGNNQIIGTDEERWKKRFASLIFQYYPSWRRKLEVQKAVRDLSENELQLGNKIIVNEAVNPAQYTTTVGTNTVKELDYINTQHTSNNKRGKVEAYTALLSVLRTDVSEDFLKHFGPLFQKIITKVWVYEEED